MDASTSAEHAIRALVAAYARGADRHDGAAVAQVFLEDGILETSHTGRGRHRIRGRAAIARAINSLTRWEATTHFLGQHVIEFDGDHATGELYCQAHHLERASNGRYVRTLWIRYQDEYTEVDSAWYLRHRLLIVDWSEYRPAPAEPSTLDPTSQIRREDA